MTDLVAKGCHFQSFWVGSNRKMSENVGKNRKNRKIEISVEIFYRSPPKTEISDILFHGNDPIQSYMYCPLYIQGVFTVLKHVLLS